MALERIQFTASTSNIVPIYQLISSILPFGGSCLLNITQNGLCFSVVDNNICKVYLTLDKRLFSSFQFYPIHVKKERILLSDEEESTTDDDADSLDSRQSVSVHLDLKSLIETINIHIPGDKDNPELRTKCILSYKGDGSPFILTFEDDFIIERCELTTLFIDPADFESEITDSQTGSAYFQLDSSKKVMELTLQSSLVYDALRDMKDLSTEELILYCSNMQSEHQRKLVLISKSEDASIGYSKLVFPSRKPFLKDMQLYKPELVDEEQTHMVVCSTTISSFYNFSYFAKILRAIKLSKSIKIRKDLAGLTSVSLLLGSSSLNGSNLSSNDGKNLFFGTSIEFITLESLANEEVEYERAKHGYNNQFVEQMIREDENVKVIKIARNGQLTTIDDYFQSVITQSAAPSSAGEPVDLQITKELAQSVLGHSPAPEPVPKETKGKQAKKRKLEGRKNNKSDKADRLQTVGGAVEIPLFI
ncbi:hypothetical protein KL921_000156 [Ogataea angusta]|nr:hypothetical protein KL921_000156 [Ogataea angusta]KAG7853586.1 hypothetical protein KL941_000636 [Ogataea angusta]